MIDEMLKKYVSAETRTYSAGEVIFSAGDKPLCYYLISKGSIKLINMNAEGEEFIQEIRKENQSIAEFTLFVDELYPFAAIAITDCTMVIFKKTDLISMLKDNPELNLYFLHRLSESLQQEFLTSKIFVNDQSLDKVTTLLNYLKPDYIDTPPYSFPIALTILEIATITGLPLEKVTKTIANMEKQNIIRTVDFKIFY